MNLVAGLVCFDGIGFGGCGCGGGGVCVWVVCCFECIINNTFVRECVVCARVNAS